MKMKTKICRLCFASFVPNKDEGYCDKCLNPIYKKTDPEYQKIEMLIQKYEKGGFKS